jgi:hypothetical protein
MTLSVLLEKALALANAGHLEVSEVEGHKRAAEKGEWLVSSKEVAVTAYAEDAAHFLDNLDGTALALQHWREAQRLLVSTRSEVRLLNEGLFFLREEVERLVATGTHRKAAAQRAEVRA